MAKMSSLDAMGVTNLHDYTCGYEAAIEALERKLQLSEVEEESDVDVDFYSPS